MTASTEAVPVVIKRIADALPLADTAAISFFQQLDSIAITSQPVGKKKEIKCKRYTFYFDLDGAIINIWMDINPLVELKEEQLKQTFAGWQASSSNEIAIKTEDAVEHKKYTYSNAKGKVDITIYLRYEQVTGVLMEFNGKS